MSNSGSSGYRRSLYLPQSEFPMRGNLAKREPAAVAAWKSRDLYGQARRKSKGRPLFVLHDGPPYANGHLHLGHALNKIAKDSFNRLWQMSGYDANYVPGWDCHGLPIEWKVEEELRAKGVEKDLIPVNEFRGKCRDFAEHWIGVQKEEFQRLGILGDWAGAYTSMSFQAESQTAREILKFARNGLLYRGAKPVMWSVAEQTALAEAEIEYHQVRSPSIFVAFPVRCGGADAASVAIWTTTPWTIPGNRAISFGMHLSYGLYRTRRGDGQSGLIYISDSCTDRVARKCGLELDRIRDVSTGELTSMCCEHPLAERGFGFDVPMLDAAHVDDGEGTGFVHTAPGHGREDFEVWCAHSARLHGLGISSEIADIVDAEGVMTANANEFEGACVIDRSGKSGSANQDVIRALAGCGALLGEGSTDHLYPHSWRSKKRVIFRSTPQWFIRMDGQRSDVDQDSENLAGSLRDVAMRAIESTNFYPSAGRQRLMSMVRTRPDWVVSRQRAWGVPIPIFVDRKADLPVIDEGINARILDAFMQEGADAWFAPGAKVRFLGPERDPEDFEKVNDILDVWFDSGASHAYVLEAREDLQVPASVYLEGTDQHRGWFQSSLLESCGTRGRAPFDAILTHGFVLDQKGVKLSKSRDDGLHLDKIVNSAGAEIIRLWVASTDISRDVRIGPEILGTARDTYRKLRNTFRWLLGNLANFDATQTPDPANLPRLERYILHRLMEIDELVASCVSRYALQTMMAELSRFAISDLSAFYFDIRKDTLYCAAPNDPDRLACLWVLEQTFRRLVLWLAPVLVFTSEEAWKARYGEDAPSIHLETFPKPCRNWAYASPSSELADVDTIELWRDDIFLIRGVINSALESARAERAIGSSLDARIELGLWGWTRMSALAELDWAEISITSQARLIDEAGFVPLDSASVLVSQDREIAAQNSDTPNRRVHVRVYPASGRKCARSWKFTEDVGSDQEFPDVSIRDADALRDKIRLGLWSASEA